MTSEETRKAAERLVKASKCTTLESLHELYGHHPLAFDSIEKTRDAIDRDKEITSGAYLDRLADDEHREREYAEPITEEWLSRNSAIVRDDACAIAGEIRGVTVVFDKQTRDCVARYRYEHSKMASLDIKTRGQLRKLLEALKGGET